VKPTSSFRSSPGGPSWASLGSTAFTECGDRFKKGVRGPHVRANEATRRAFCGAIKTKKQLFDKKNPLILATMDGIQADRGQAPFPASSGNRFLPFCGFFFLSFFCILYVKRRPPFDIDVEDQRHSAPQLSCRRGQSFATTAFPTPRRNTSDFRPSLPFDLCERALIKIGRCRHGPLLVRGPSHFFLQSLFNAAGNRQPFGSSRRGP